MDLLDESVDRAREIVKDKNSELPDDEQSLISDCVGVNVMRYADLMQNRSTNYTFSKKCYRLMVTLRHMSRSCKN